MSLTFYRAPMSTATVTELVLAEVDVPHETVTLDLKKAESKTPEHRKLDPNGRVPVFVHDGVPIWESAAITIYVGETFGTWKKLWPEAGPKRGEAIKWVVWANATFAEAVGRWQRNTSTWAPPDHQNAKAGEAGKADVAACLRILDDALADRPFLCGAYTLADTHLNAFLDWLRHLKMDLAPYANVEAWTKRCGDRPAYRKVMGRAD